MRELIWDDDLSDWRKDFEALVLGAGLGYGGEVVYVRVLLGMKPGLVEFWKGGLVLLSVSC